MCMDLEVVLAILSLAWRCAEHSRSHGAHDWIAVVSAAKERAGITRSRVWRRRQREKAMRLYYRGRIVLHRDPVDVAAVLRDHNTNPTGVIAACANATMIHGDFNWREVSCLGISMHRARRFDTGAKRFDTGGICVACGWQLPNACHALP